MEQECYNSSNQCQILDEDMDPNELLFHMVDIPTENLTTPAVNIQEISTAHENPQSNDLLPQTNLFCHLHQLPELTDIENETHFNVMVPVEDGQTPSWYYDASSKNVFLQMAKRFNVKIEYLAWGQPMYLRIMPSYTAHADIHEPVKRCENHKKSSREIANLEHVVQCRNENVTYHGEESETKYGKRLSLVVYLQANNGLVSENISLEFMCQNSCPGGINRRATAVIFNLEDAQGWIYGRRLIHLRVCTSPKRDYNTFIAKAKVKRPVSDTDQGSAKRPKTTVKIEPGSPDAAVANSRSEDITLPLTLPREDMINGLRAMEDRFAGDVARGKQDTRSLKIIQKLIASQNR